ncbi:MAG: hypothetical protein IJS17_05180 [Clostridia bacterium]|nr:hypothetical protein [Clostridia bacterium]
MKKTESKNLSEFIRAINADADRACEKIKNESLKEKRQKLSDTSKLLESQCGEKIGRAEKNLQSETNKAIAALENKMRDELIQKRNQIRLDVFSKVETKLKAFTKTADYCEFLLRSAAEIGKKLKGENLVLFMREEDIKFSEDVKKAVGKTCDIQTDSAILFGGLKASTDIQAADDTLDGRLENEKDWFANNSNLKIV